MPRFAANLSMMYTDVPFLERFARAAADGFAAVEYLFPYDFDAQDIRTRLENHGLQQVLFNAPPGDWDKGERGMASLPGREDEFKRSIERALDYAKVIGCPTLHVMAGNRVPLMAHERQRAIFMANLSHAADMAASAGVTLTLEPINRRNMPQYFLEHQDDAQELIFAIGKKNIMVQFDIYHCQITEGDIATRLLRDLPTIGHIQIASVPDRHEPDTGEVNYPWLFEYLDKIGYSKWIGCEYIPSADTSAGLGWFQKWREK